MDGLMDWLMISLMRHTESQFSERKENKEAALISCLCVFSVLTSLCRECWAPIVSSSSTSLRLFRCYVLFSSLPVPYLIPCVLNQHSFAFMLCFLVSEENRPRLDSTSAMLFSTSPEVCCFPFPGPAASSWITTGIDAFLLLFLLFHSEGPILSPKSSSNLTAVNSSPLHLHFGAVNHAVFIVTSYSFSGHC